jgi:hypothetical protein
VRAGLILGINRQSMGAKLMKVLARRYLMYGMIMSLTWFFAVPKGDTYFRMVYNGTSSGMIAHLWAPWFTLPTICALLRTLDLDTFTVDSDIGEIFLNFMLEESCARLAVVDLTHYVEKGEDAQDGKRHLARWVRCLMGGTFSPYQTGQGMGHVKERIMGDPNDVYNVFKWKYSRLNLPGTSEYNPSMAWVTKSVGGLASSRGFVYLHGRLPPD